VVLNVREILLTQPRESIAIPQARSRLVCEPKGGVVNFLGVMRTLFWVWIIVLPLRWPVWHHHSFLLVLISTLGFGKKKKGLLVRKSGKDILSFNFSITKLADESGENGINKYPSTPYVFIIFYEVVGIIPIPPDPRNYHEPERERKKFGFSSCYALPNP
jgi:hypothetical protein